MEVVLFSLLPWTKGFPPDISSVAGLSLLFSPSPTFVFVHSNISFELLEKTNWFVFWSVLAGLPTNSNWKLCLGYQSKWYTFYYAKNYSIFNKFIIEIFFIPNFLVLLTPEIKICTVFSFTKWSSEAKSKSKTQKKNCRCLIRLELSLSNSSKIANEQKRTEWVEQIVGKYTLI